MKKLLIAVFAASLVPALAVAPAFAACQDEIDTVSAAFESAELSESDQDAVSQAIDSALENAESGNEDACLTAVDEAKSILQID